MKLKLKQSYRETLMFPDSSGDEIEKGVNENEHIKKQLLEGKIVTFLTSLGGIQLGGRAYIRLEDFEIEEKQND